MLQRSRSRGFTLIELMIVVVIVAIIAAIAVPSYLGQVRKSRRSDARDALLELQLEQEKFRANCVQYATTLGAASDCGTNTIGFGGTSKQDYYTISIVSANASSYLLRAVPVGTEDQVRDSGCQSFTLNQDSLHPGPDGIVGNADDDADACW